MASYVRSITSRPVGIGARTRRLIVAFVGAVVAATFSLAFAGSASATVDPGGYTSDCQGYSDHALCLFWGGHENTAYAYEGVLHSPYNLDINLGSCGSTGCSKIDFMYGGSKGRGEPTRNNAESVANQDLYNLASVYVYPNYVGPKQVYCSASGFDDDGQACQTMLDYGNLNSTLINNEASVCQDYWYGTYCP